MNLVLNIALLVFILYSFYCGIASIGRKIVFLVRKVFKKDGKYIECRTCNGCDTGAETLDGQSRKSETID